jgi:hypothetical protein
MIRKPAKASIRGTSESARPEVSVLSDAITRENWDDVQECVLVAQVLVDQYGEDAPLRAEASASKLLLDWADLEAWAYWKRAGRAAQQLLQTEPAGPLH